MYKKNQAKSQKNKFILFIPSAILVVALMIFILYKMNIINLFSGKTNTSSSVVSPSSEVANEKSTNTVDYGPANPSDNTPVPDKNPNAPDQTVNNELSATITSTRKSTDGANYLVKVAVLGTESGSCTLTMSKGSKVLTVKSDITMPANQYSCSELKIPMTSIDESGEWDITVSITDQNGATFSTSTKVVL